MTSPSTRAASFILRELVGELLYWPVWWYSRGVASVAKSLADQWLDLIDQLGLRLLLKNMFVPMYAQYTFSGRVISFFFRVLILGYRLVVVAFRSAFWLLLLLVWILAPAVAMAMLVRQLFPGV